MRFLARYAFPVLLLGAMLSGASAQTAQKQNTGIITGRVTFGEKAAPNVGVALFPADRTMPDRSSIMKTTTDYEGRYRMTNVPAGRFNVVAVAPAYVGPNEGMFGEPGKTVNVSEGETVEKIDFTLVKGGVITGRVTTADGVPVIGERVQLNQADNQTPGRQRGVFNLNPFMFETDDRGVYRLYGISPGRYTISIGEAPDGGAVRFGFGGRGYYARTFHPGVAEAAKATVIEVTEGSEASNIDITLAGKSKAFTATGRVVDESGKPVVGVRVGNGAITREANNRMGAFGWGSLSDANGNFRLDSLTPGRYAAFVWNEDNEIDGYSEPVTFEITDGNISGLELKLRRGASISGVAVVEGTTDRAVLAKLSQLTLVANIEGEGLAAPTYPRVKISPDGSFRINGLRAGKARLFLSTYPPVPGFALGRVERDGVPQNPIEVAAGAQVTGIRVVIEYGTGSVRGLVKVENGPLPEGGRMYVSARRKGDTGLATRGAQVDSRGRFLLEGMSTGEFELTIRTFIPGMPPRGVAPVRQVVTVTSGVETDATFTVDLNAKDAEGGNND
jgi:protocatechuate 3,4-dioxygenase beta subunit